MGNSQHRGISINIILVTSAIVGLIGFIVLAAIGAGQFWPLVAGFIAVLTASVALVRVVSTPFVKIQSILLERQREANRHEETMVKAGLLRPALGYEPIEQIAAPPQQQSKPEPIDPRHALLVNLTLLTIRTNRVGDNTYGPTSDRLMTADDAQAISSTFADRNNWDLASKYGQSIGYLYVKLGGKVSDQGLKIKGVGNNTAADLIGELVNRNLVLDAGVNALPGVNR